MINKAFLRILLYIFFGSVVIKTDGITESRKTSITKAIEIIGPAVASINVEQQNISPLSFDPFFGFMLPSEIYPMKSSGSGVIISPEGFLITNYHVIENAERVTITLPGGDEYEAKIIGSDQTSDLALLKLEGDEFPYAILGNSDNLIIGEWVIALGNPFELFSVSNMPSASVGIVSATNMDFGLQKSGKVFQNMIQTDAAINPGNSGGPLVNALGEVIGINTFIFRDYDKNRGAEGIGFAIPINSAKRIAEELRLSGEIDRGYSTGLVVQKINVSIARYLDLPFVKGLIIVEIAKKSPAHYSSLRLGDVIINVNGIDVNNPDDIRTLILENDLRSGDNLDFKIFRNGKYKNVKMKLGKYKKKRIK